MNQHANRLLRTIWLLALFVTLSCGEADESATSAEEAFVDVTSLDGRLQVALPQRLIVHRHQTSIQATEADGTLRYFIGYQPDEKLVRMIGSSKSIVTRHEWTVKSEKHYAQAYAMRLGRKRAAGDVQENRTIWFVPVGDGVVVCDGIAVAQKEEVLGAPFKKLCTGIHMIEDASIKTSKGDETETK